MSSNLRDLRQKIQDVDSGSEGENNATKTDADENKGVDTGALLLSAFDELDAQRENRVAQKLSQSTYVGDLNRGPQIVNRGPQVTRATAIEERKGPIKQAPPQVKIITTDSQKQEMMPSQSIMRRGAIAPRTGSQFGDYRTGSELSAVATSRTGSQFQADMMAQENLETEMHESVRLSVQEERDARKAAKFNTKSMLLSGQNYSDDSDNSDSDGELISDSIKDIVKKAKNERIRLGIGLKVSLYANAGPVALVELNERMSKSNNLAHISQNASKLFSIKQPDFYQVKRELLLHSTLRDISFNLFRNKDHPYFDRVTCITMHGFKTDQIIFVGNAKGYIRAFSMDTAQEKKPLFDPKVRDKEVVSMDISADGRQLVAAYKQGSLKLWDLKKYKLVHEMEDVAMQGTGEFVLARFLYSLKDYTFIITAERNGRVRIVNMKRKLLGNYSHLVNSLYESDFKQVSSIAVQPQKRSNNKSKQDELKNQSCLTAISGPDQVSIVQLRPFPAKPIKVIKRPQVCIQQRAPTLAWGRGLTPSSSQHHQTQLLVIAWDQIIQIVRVVEERQEQQEENQEESGEGQEANGQKENPQDDRPLVELDGYYCSEHVINQVYFMADSVLVILVNRTEFKVLYTKDFAEGNVDVFNKGKHLGLNITDGQFFKQSIKDTRASVLEKGHVNRKIKTESIENDQKVSVNFNNTICQYKKNILVIGDSDIYRARLLSWTEFIDKLRFEDNKEWLTILKVALEIYRGEIRGLALLPDTKERREQVTVDYMKKLIMSTIQQAVPTTEQRNRERNLIRQESRELLYSFKKEHVVIQAALEFCLQVTDHCFIFKEVYNFFVEKNHESAFLRILSAGLQSGMLRDVVIPEHILRKIIKSCQDKRKFDDLENIILNINISEYQNHCNDQIAASVRAYLEKVCHDQFIVGGLEHLSTSDMSKDADPGCKIILDLIFNKLTKSNEDQCEAEQKMSRKTRNVTRHHLEMLRNTEKKLKFEIEKSNYYTGYRLIWMMSEFIKGKKIPNGILTREQHKAHVFNIIDFVTRSETLEYFIEFDPEAFFYAMSSLFHGSPWWFMNMDFGDYEFEFIKKGTIKANCEASEKMSNHKANQRIQLSKGKLNVDTMDTSEEPCRLGNLGPNICKVPHANQILVIFKQAVLRIESNQRLNQTYFHELILQVVVNQYNNPIEEDNDSQIAELSDDQKEFKFLDKIGKSIFRKPQKIEELERKSIQYEYVLEAIKNVLLGKEGKIEGIDHVKEKDLGDPNHNEINQALIIATLKAVKLKKEHAEKILRKLIKAGASNLDPVKVALYENMKDYSSAFLLHLRTSVLKKELFKWLNSTFEVLNQRDQEKIQQQEKIKKAELWQSIRMAQSVVEGEDQSAEHTQILQQPQSIDVSVSMVDDESQIMRERNYQMLNGQTVIQSEQDPEKCPLRKLKKQVKNKIEQLVSISSKQTVQFVQKYLNEGNFQEDLIMNKLNAKGDLEQAQFNYLENLITHNEKDIQACLYEFDTDINIEADRRAQAIKYQKYIRQFLKLFCMSKIEKDTSIEQWVTKSYFPVDECLKICEAAKNLHGQAILKQRGGKPIKAIDRYLKILGQIPINELVEQLEIVYEHKPNFLPQVEIDEMEGTIREIRNPVQNRNFFEPETITEFDKFLGKACEICIFQNLDEDLRIQGWFSILSYLQQFGEEANYKCSEAVRLAKINVGKKAEYCSLHSYSVHKYAKRLQEFIRKRFNYILTHPSLDIPLKTIMQKLSLSFSQIKKVCKLKLKHNETTLNIEKCQQQIIENQLIDMFHDNFEKQSAGYVIEPKKRLIVSTRSAAQDKRLPNAAKVNAAPRRIKGNTICNCCLKSVQDQSKPEFETVLIYQCAHQFHASCLEKLQKQTGYTQCPPCMNLNYLAIRELKERQQQEQLRAQGGGGGDNDSDQEENQDKKGGNDSDDEFERNRQRSMQAWEENPEETRRKLQQRQFDQFDKILDDINLELQEFEAAIADEEHF